MPFVLRVRAEEGVFHVGFDLPDQHVLLLRVFRIFLDGDVGRLVRVLDHVGERLHVGIDEALHDVAVLGDHLLRREQARAVDDVAEVRALQDRERAGPAGLGLELRHLGVEIARDGIDAAEQQVILVGRIDGALLDVVKRHAVGLQERLQEHVGRARRLHADIEAFEVLRLCELVLARQRQHGERAVLVHRRKRHHRHVLRARHRQRRQVAEAEFGIAVADQPHRIGRAGAAPDRGNVDALLGEISLFLGDEEHRVVAAHHVVELHAHLVVRRAADVSRIATATAARRRLLGGFH